MRGDFLVEPVDCIDCGFWVCSFCVLLLSFFSFFDLFFVLSTLVRRKKKVSRITGRFSKCALDAFLASSSSSSIAFTATGRIQY